jgi:hypothetical protein
MQLRIFLRQFSSEPSHEELSAIYCLRLELEELVPFSSISADISTLLSTTTKSEPFQAVKNKVEKVVHSIR